MHRKVVEKVVAYITKGTHLLVFRHVHADAGIQVPAGTLEAGEAPDEGVLREAHEETGLNQLEIRRFLGTREYDMSSLGRAEIHRRYYYHLECRDETPPKWRHFELHPSEGPARQLEFELFWVRLPDQVPNLAGAQGDFLELVDKLS